ncbi:MAG: helix-turn-helix transcriptional regulator [Clostridia bacterium]|nr:helix-turn-helix transcriptional regulator [Clostridia bacterium]
MKPYNKILHDIREDHDLTQSDIARVLKTTQQVYSRYEKGENEIPIRHIITLCQYYNISADYLLGLKEERTPLK